MTEITVGIGRRANRRHLAFVAKARARRRILSWSYGRELASDIKRIAQAAWTPQSCSYPWCGNRRELDGPTRRERMEPEKVD